MSGFGFGTRSGLHRNSQSSSDPVIVLSASTIAESAPVGSTIGTLSVLNGDASYTFSVAISGDPDAKFTLLGADLTTSDTLDFETAAFHQVTLEADNGVDPALSRSFVISVMNVNEQPDLGPLSIPGPVTRGSTVSIVGATVGSTISAPLLPAGWTLDGPNREIAIAADAPTGNQGWLLLETLEDSANSPNSSSGTTEVKAPVSTSFVPEDAGFVMFDKRDVGAGSVAEWAARDGRNSISNNAASEQPQKASSLVQFDGVNDVLKDTARSLGTPISYDLDAVWSASPLGDTDQFTNTGITRAPDGTWWVVNHPAGAPTRSDGILVHFSADFSSILDTMDLGSIFGVGTIGGPQGVVYDTDDDTLWFTSALADEIKHVTLAGAEINDAIPFPNPAGLAIDQANGTLIILESEGSAANKNAGVIRTANKATGATVASGTLTDMPDWDQLFFDQESRALFITAGYEYAGLGDTHVGIYNMDGASYLHQIAYIREPTATAIEGVTYHEGTLYICNNSGFHGGLGSGLNEVLEYDVGQIVGSKIALAGVIQSGGTSGTDAIMALDFPISGGDYGVALLIGGATELRFFNRSASSNENENYTFSTPNVATSERIFVAELDPTLATPGRLWIDGTQASGTVTGGAAGQFTGPICDRVNLALGAALDGGSEERHSEVDTHALGYRIFNASDLDRREEIEGWLAHEFGLESQLPAAHPYKTNAP